MAHYVIIGNGAAGTQAALAARKQDPKAEITVVSREKHLLYYRYNLPHFLAGKKSPEEMLVHPKEYYDERNITHILGETVAALDTKNRKVTLSSGRMISYDSLLVASGSYARKAVWPGSDLDGVVTLREWDDVPVIKSHLARTQDAVVIGGGLLGIEFAWAFRELGCNVAYLIKEDRFWPQMLDTTASSIIHARLKQAGVNLMVNEGLKEIRGGSGGAVTGVVTETGKEIPCGVVGVAIGAVPETGLLSDSGIQVERGIIADDRLQTNVPDVYAAGDVAQAWDVVQQSHRVNTSWLNAYKQGGIAGANMAGGDKKFEGGLAMNSMEIYGVSFASMGTPNAEGPEYTSVSSSGTGGDTYKKVVFRDGAVVGATLLGDVAQARYFEDLIKRQVTVPEEKRSDILRSDFDFKSLT